MLCLRIWAESKVLGLFFFTNFQENTSRAHDLLFRHWPRFVVTGGITCVRAHANLAGEAVFFSDKTVERKPVVKGARSR